MNSKETSVILPTKLSRVTSSLPVYLYAGYVLLRIGRNRHLMESQTMSNLDSLASTSILTRAARVSSSSVVVGTLPQF